MNDIKEDESGNIELTQKEGEDIADNLAKKVGAEDRFDMFNRFNNGEYDGLDIELTISAYKHLLGE